MPQIYANAAAGTITDAPLGTTATAINSAAFANLPTVAAPDFMYLIVDPTAVGGLPEIIKVTAHGGGATSITAVRYAQVQSGLTAPSGRTHVAGTIWRHVATKASFDDLAALVPAGTVRTTVNTAADPGWQLFNQTLVGAQTAYPALWAVAPAAWKSGADLVLPNMADRDVKGAGTTANGAVGGANSKTIASGNLPTHTHTVDPPSTAVSITDPGHFHSTTVPNGTTAFGGSPVTGAYTVTGSVASDTKTTGISASVDITSFASGNGGFANTALDVTNAHLALTYQIKAH